MAFDPDKYIQSNAQFDPDQYLTQAQAPENKPGYLETLARGAAQGGSLGFADEATAAAEAALTNKSYEQALKESRGNYAAAEKENPYTYLAGQILGGFIPITGVAGKAVAAGKGLMNAGKAVGLGTKIAKGVGAGAGLGALQGLGTSEADLTKGEVGQAAKDVVTGGVIGGAVGGLLPVAGNVAKSGYEIAPELIKKVVDTGVATAKGLNPFGFVKEKATNVAQTGSKLGKLLQDFDKKSSEEITSILSPEQKFDFKDELNQYSKKLVNQLKKGTVEDKQSIQNAIENLHGVDPKMNLQDFMNFEKDVSDLIPRNRGTARATISDLRTNIRDDLLGKIKEAYPDQPEISDRFAELFANRSKMHQILDVLPKGLSKGAGPEDAKILGKFVKQSKPLSGYGVGAEEGSLPLIGGQTSAPVEKGGQVFEGAYDKMKQIIPESSPVISDLEKQTKLLELSKFGKGGELFGWTAKNLAQGAAGLGGAIARPAVALEGGINKIFDLTTPAIKAKAAAYAAKGHTNAANFLNNFADADVVKKKSMAFAASQNPELRKLFEGGETSEHKE